MSGRYKSKSIVTGRSNSNRAHADSSGWMREELYRANLSAPVTIIKGPKPPKCPSCGSYLEKRKGPYSEFWGCHEYPRCTYKRKL